MKPCIINDLNRVELCQFSEIIESVVDSFGRRINLVTAEEVAKSIAEQIIIEADEESYIFPLPKEKMPDMWANPVGSYQVVYFDYDMDEEVRLVRVDEYQGIIRVLDNMTKDNKQSITISK